MKKMNFILILILIKFVYSEYERNSDKINDYVKDYKQPVDSIEYENKMKEYNFECLKNEMNMRNITSRVVLKMTIEEKLKEFQKSNCPPLVILPGFMGSKMEFKMKNCRLFQQYHQNIMKSCGWESCDKPEIQRFPIWINTGIDMMEIVDFVLLSDDNKKRKRIKNDPYIPHFIRKLKVDEKVIEYHHRQECFGNLFRVYYTNDKSENNNTNLYKMTNLKGAEIKIKQSNKKECGVDVVSNYLGNMFSVNRAFQGFSKLDQFLINMGYTRGLNLFYHPYDFRLPIKSLVRRIESTIKTAYRITKKKPILIGHSYGGLLAYKMTQIKNATNIIQEVIAINSPFLGTHKGADHLLMKTNLIDLEKFINIYGYDISVIAKIDTLSIRLIFNSFPHLHLLPQNVLNDDIDLELEKIANLELSLTTFNKTEIKKIIVENSFMNYFYKIFPKIYSQCNSIASKNFKNNPICKINHKNLNLNKILEIDNNDFIMGNDFNKTLRNVFIKNWHKDSFSFNKHLHDDFKIDPELLFDHFISNHDKEFYNLTRPQVPFTLIYANHLDTVDNKIYKKGKLEKVQHSSGDDTINSYSMVYPGLRWLYEDFRNENKNNPIHIVEYCAYHEKKNIKTYDKDKTQYISLSCDCIEQTNLNPTEECNHTGMIGDTKFIMFLGEVVNRSQSRVEKIENFENLYEEKFNMRMLCSHLDLS